MPNEISTEPTIFQCRHIFTDGRRCGSPALRDPESRSDQSQPFCYFHHRTRRPVRNPATRRRRQARFTLPNPEDRSAIQHSIGEVLRRIASNDIDPRRAGLLLYGLQIASLNLPKSNPADESQLVSEITHHPKHGLLAPPAELHANRPKSSLELLLEALPCEESAPQPTTESAIALHASAADPAPAEATPAGPSRRTPTHTRHRILPSAHERMSSMSDFIPKPSSPKLSGLGPKAQKLAALREKAAAQAKTNAAAATGASTSAAKPKNSFAGKKTAFQRKAT